MSQNETSGTVAVDNQKIRTKQMVLIALMTAVTCVLGPLSIPLPFSPVPISLTNFAIFLAIFVLGMKSGTISFIIYLLLGAIGVPVFSSFRGGLQVLAGPTGGYLIGFIFLALIMGFALEHFDRKLVPTIIGMIIGMAVCYAFGTVWLAKLLSLSFKEGLMMGVIPYLAGDAAKIIIAAIVGPKLYGATQKIR
ncbi:biotin transporter BioY [Mediterraneibacter faecis]|mgnify:FL=1|uniref:biotin transporter BioY n=1 Tax=Mediterraneibacter faecis TaxID=592978 RepID=UPI001D090457|nr:biotin transporter BioY [Mediterraneibacter faecis]MCB5920796.1 biotin transporter BioY [Lachnospiraceae bacterium 210521-DFI.1.105]MCB6298746.1 biotin transporter BioY [Mediterraneibacter faecis]MCB6445428.1 biotin transporter BioY [Mediterraneibacter faecis]MCQ5257384.1 biotin transporter BioY [Mediterraneibacter faecis]MCQ5260357.1 biotin transporter BioY [Mediterraneibacter faecis]